MSSPEFVTDTRRSKDRFDNDWHIIKAEETEDGQVYYRTACDEQIWAELSQILRDGDPRDTLHDPQVEKSETVCPQCEHYL